MNPFDMLAIVILVICLIRGLFRGLIKEMASVIGILGGFYAAYTYYPLAVKPISVYVPNPSHHNIIAFLILFFGVAVIIGILGLLIKFLLRITFMGWMDRACGAGIGLIKGVLIVAVLAFVFTFFVPKGASLVRKSCFAPYMTEVSDKIALVVPKKMQTQYVDKSNVLKKAKARPK
jgi:membrane protein required for colicin V production